MELKKIKDSAFVLGDAVETLKGIESEQFHLCVTSPPYFNQREEYASYKDLDQYLDEMGLIFTEVFRTLKPGRIFACNIGQDRSVDLPAFLSRIIHLVGFKYVDSICWDKGGEIGERGQFIQKGKYYPNFRWEPLLIYRKPPRDLGAGVKDGDDFPEFEFGDMEYINTVLRTNLWQITPQRNSWHPAPYPINLPKNVIKCYTKRGEIVLDIFGGSGTTAKAAIETDRLYFLTERLVEYYNAAIEDLNGQNLSLGL